MLTQCFAFFLRIKTELPAFLCLEKDLCTNCEKIFAKLLCYLTASQSTALLARSQPLYSTERQGLEERQVEEIRGEREERRRRKKDAMGCKKREVKR